MIDLWIVGSALAVGYVLGRKDDGVTQYQWFVLMLLAVIFSWMFCGLIWATHHENMEKK